MAKADVTAQRLREFLHYDADTGVFTWIVDRSPKTRRGDVAGSIYSNGYRMIGIDWKYTSAHRLAWLYVHGKMPETWIDHINGDKTDNRIANLRDVPPSMNSQNQRRPHADKTSCRLMGATWDKMWGNWKAQLRLKGRTIYLGRFKTAEEAHQAYLEGKRRLHEGCTV